MASYASRAKFHDALYRLCGTTTSDGALVEQGETADEVADLCLTNGIRRAQLFMIESGYQDWIARSSALSWTGTDAANGGKYSALPAAFLRGAGDENRSSLVEVNGDPWGREVPAESRHWKGDGFYYLGDQVWLLRTAQPPTTLYLEHFTQHEEFSSSLADADIVFPEDARGLVVAYAADFARDEGWFPLADSKAIDAAVFKWERLARQVALRSKTPRKMRPRRQYGNHYYT